MIEVVESPIVKVGTVYMVEDGLTLIVGTMPMTDVERAGYHARYLVNKGLRDIVEWLGEKPLPANPANITFQALREIGEFEASFEQMGLM